MSTYTDTYNDLTDLTRGELFFWIAVDETLEQIGGQDVAAAFAILAGQPLLPTRSKFAARPRAPLLPPSPAGRY